MVTPVPGELPYRDLPQNAVADVSLSMVMADAYMVDMLLDFDVAGRSLGGLGVASADPPPRAHTHMPAARHSRWYERPVV